MLEYLEAGKIMSPHGVRGEMKLEVWGDDLKQLKTCGKVYFSSKGGTAKKITSLRPQGSLGLLMLEGIEDMDAARTLTGRVIYVARSDTKLPKGSYFLQDLIGCRVQDANTQQVYGEIVEVSHPGAQDLYTIRLESGELAMLPAVPAFVKECRPEEGVVWVTPIPGLLGGAENADEEAKG